jgi:pimeloyl-ACP methyl ester carboxylesterase
MPKLTIQGKELDFLRLQPSFPLVSDSVIVMLHEGLGSISLWRDFPQQVAEATGHEVLVYSRYGYGNSEASPGFPFSYMHDEGLKFLPELLERLDIKKPILFGHSDGASITLIAAGGSKIEPKGVIVMAPHVIVEQICFDAITDAQVAYQQTDLKDKLGKHHADVDSAFFGWSNAWLSPEFKNWNIEEYLPMISCPILAIQGYEDEYGTMAQIDKIVERSKKAAFVDTLKIENCRHSPHKDQTKIVLDQITHFIKKLK